ncbi:glycosyltransferase [Leptolyngbya cf. ectocarpi LEGE 11479]|uniref:Glycosyltransferase n=1 Tax=Leptolyngbya cf. ectocarpi LEGE 11479 TaxID=1828722 RepID=A0A928ZUH4_LEPEC|nr:glycosyltransferase family 2 protein [Leptolyngbya ectocarpi]MBE9067683.1 glycosyltransferase [Leptolyngbya cf. ectocarpi LEGE 11479]
MQEKNNRCDSPPGRLRQRTGADVSVLGYLRSHQPWQIASKLIFLNVLLIGLPTIVCYYSLELGNLSLKWLHVSLVILYLTSAAMLVAESTAAVWRRFAGQSRFPLSSPDIFKHRLKQGLGIRGADLPKASQPLPRCSFIVAAYLPNEQSIILDTVDHLLNRVHQPEAGLEVILAYNTPVALPMEATLSRLARKYPNFRPYRVEGSHSKAENINAALNIVTGDITCILDADHHPAPDCFERASRWIANGYDVVQGRNMIRNRGENLLTRLVAVEFESIYGVSHSAKSLMVDTALFGGSNGYWRTSVLQQIRFNPTMLTEDIDASIRTLLHGYRIVHDRSITVTELAPNRISAFWSQRKRWSQGWLEVSLRYQKRFWKSSQLTFGQKLIWTHLLYYRELFPILSVQILPIVFSSWLVTGTISFTDNAFLLSATVVTFLSSVYKLVVTAKVGHRHYPAYYFIQYALLTPFYSLFKNMIAVVALYDHLHGKTDWVVTPRDVVPAVANFEKAYAVPETARL